MPFVPIRHSGAAPIDEHRVVPRRGERETPLVGLEQAVKHRDKAPGANRFGEPRVQLRQERRGRGSGLAVGPEERRDH
jgi:hypothetical protein